MKSCGDCGQEKALEDFYRCARAKDGRQSRCKECDATRLREWRRNNPDKVREQNQRGYAKNGLDRQRRWQNANPEAVKAIKRAYRERHPERVREQKRRQYAQNRERENERSRRWRAANPERKRDYKYRRRQLTRVLDSLTTDYQKILRQDPCSYCGGLTEHVDHIDSLAAGGTHTWDNLTSACALCNQHKRTHSLLIHMTTTK